MQSNKLRMAIRSTAAVAILGVAGQASALEMSAGDVKASLYGYARLNMSYDLDDNLADPTQSGLFSNITGSDIDGHFGASANQSRVGINLENKEGVKVNFEGDFYAGNFRIRKAYGEYNGLLAGQTWSNYNSFIGNTPTLDFTGAAGWAGYQLRTPQVRYTTGGLSVSVEDPRNGGVLDNRGTAKDGMPAFTARFAGGSDALSFSVAGLVKQSSIDDGSTVDESATGFAAFADAKLALSDILSIQGAINYSNGANAYLYNSGAADAYDDGSGLETISGIGASIGASLGLGGGRSVNLALGMTQVDWDDAVDDGVTGAAGQAETNQNLFLNYQWTPVANTMMGIEYQYWDTETQSGNSEDANRVMFAAQYNF
jgi:hypothetical protein